VDDRASSRTARACAEPPRGFSVLLTSASGLGIGAVTLALYTASLVAAVPRPVFPPLRRVAQAAWRARGGAGSGDVPEPERRLRGEAVAPVGGWSDGVRVHVDRILQLPTVETRWAAITASSVPMPALAAWLGPTSAGFPDPSAWRDRAARAGLGVLRLPAGTTGTDASPEDVDEDALVGLDAVERDRVLALARDVVAASGAQTWVVCVEGLDALRLLRALAAVVSARDRVGAVVVLDGPLRGEGGSQGGPWAPDSVSDWMTTWFRHERLDVEWLRPVPWLTASRTSPAPPSAVDFARWGAARLPEPGFVGDGGWFRAQEPATLVVEDLGVFVVDGDAEALWSTLAAVGALAALAAAG
jgi:hypothetical protein